MKSVRYERLGETVHQETLPNGLEIRVVPKPEHARKYAFFATRYGGMDTRFQLNGKWLDTPAGIAHYLEHKMFDMETENIMQSFAQNGASDNAFTSNAVTAYYFSSTGHFYENLRTLLRFVSTPYFTRESVDKEQGIIGQEIRMGDDDPSNEVFYGLMKCLYAHNPIRVNIAGTVESIAEITADTLYTCHRAFYNPGGMVLWVAGSVDPERVARIAQEILPRIAVPTVETDFGPAEEPQVFQPSMEKEMAVSAPLFLVGFKGAPAQKGEEQRQYLLGGLVCDVLVGPSSPLYTRLYGEGLINNSFESGYESEPQCAFLSMGGESRQPEKVRDAILAEAARVAKEGLDEGLWERQKKARYGSMVCKLNSLENLCIEGAQAHFSGEDFLDFPARFRSITKADAEDFIRSWLTPQRCALSVIRPKEE